MKLAGKTDVGRVRQDNQDDYRAGELPGDAAWALVCDGMGGARGGREASQCACSVIERCFQEQYSQCIPGEEETFLKKRCSAPTAMCSRRHCGRSLWLEWALPLSALWCAAARPI